jgi:ubiquinone/menaquinone biosynthesis C-methylase UbiE
MARLRRLSRTRPPQRADYERVWDALSPTESDAVRSVAGHTDEALLRSSAEITIGRVRDAIGIGPDDTVLEIGAGVGRLGAIAAPLCKEWIGGDVSERMLGYMSERLAGVPNTRFVKLNGFDLSGIPPSSVDVVYCIVVFMHLDEWDRYGYVLDSARVLKPGGRLYVDNFSVCTQRGWELFESLRREFPPAGRPPQISKSSTPDELRTYLERAGFDGVQTALYDDLWVAAFGHLPG